MLGARVQFRFGSSNAMWITFLSKFGRRRRSSLLAETGLEIGRHWGKEEDRDVMNGFSKKMGSSRRIAHDMKENQASCEFSYVLINN